MCSTSRELMAKKCPKMCNLCGKLTFADGIKVFNVVTASFVLELSLSRFRVSFEMPKWWNSEPSELCLLMSFWLEGSRLFR